MNNMTNKQFFKNYGILLALFLFAFVILIYSVKLSRKGWSVGLRNSVEKVLNEKQDLWLVGDNITLSNPITTNACAFEILNKETKETATAVIVRITTVYGPLSAVYISDENENVVFAGFSSLHGRIAKQFENKKIDQGIDYWKKKVPSILAK